MKMVDPHIHMSSRTTSDYEQMAKAGILVVVEPAFWIGRMSGPLKTIFFL